jgi:hypothetical protein
MPWNIDDRAALGLEGLLHHGGEAFAVGRLVVEDGDLVRA